MVEAYRYEWHLMLGHAIDPERVRHLCGHNPNSLVDNLLYVLEHGTSANYTAKRQPRLFKPNKRLLESAEAYWGQDVGAGEEGSGPSPHEHSANLTLTRPGRAEL